MITYECIEAKAGKVVGRHIESEFPLIPDSAEKIASLEGCFWVYDMGAGFVLAITKYVKIEENELGQIANIKDFW